MLILPLLSIIGLSSLISSFLRMSLSSAFIITTAFISVLAFILALTGYLPQGTLLILSTGTGAFIFTLYITASGYKTNPVARDHLKTMLYFLIFSAGIALFVWGLRFRSIDDYSFWGIMSKYLYVFNQLPTNNHYISDSFLTYVPGMSCFHYLFYTAAGGYSQFTGYLAQGTVLLSAFMVLFDARSIHESLLKTALVFIILTIGFGTIFARMEVDGYVAAYLFAIFWMIYKWRERDNLGGLIFFPILFLSLIKEIGLLFALMSILAFVLTTKKSKKNIIYALSSLVGVLALKWIWVIHCQHLGFHGFSQAITLYKALQALNPLNPYFHVVQKLFIKGIFLESFGHILSWPNVFSYVLLAGIWRVQPSSPQAGLCAIRLKWVFMATLGIYLLMIYLLQAIVFDVGHTHPHLLGFQRYFNMLLIPFTLFSVLIYFEKKRLEYGHPKKAPLPIGITVLAVIFIISGKIERMQHAYLPHQIYPLVKKVTDNLPMQANWSLCLQNPPSPTDEVSIPLAYFLLPHPILYPTQAKRPCDFTMEWRANHALALIKIKNSSLGGRREPVSRVFN